MKQLDKPIVLEKLTPAERRVVIAKDVIAALREKKITAEQGVYLALRTGGKTEEGEPLRPAIGKLKACEVCALGALFVAKVARFNDFNIGNQEDYDRGPGLVRAGREEMHVNLNSHFELGQLELIECAFEKSSGFATVISRSWGDQAAQFGLRYYDDDTARMRAIMRNIVKSAGAFKP